MNAHSLITQLDTAEKAIVDRINRRMPADTVPDHIAIPQLNRLEHEQGEAEKAFAEVRRLITYYLLP